MSAPTRVRLCLLFVAILALNPGAPGIPVPIVSRDVPSPGHAPSGSPIHNVTTPLADGQLDPTFGSGGKTTSAFQGGYDIARATTLQPDGKIVVAGSADVRFAVGATCRVAHSTRPSA